MNFVFFSTIDSPESSNPSNASNAFVLVSLSNGIVKSFEIVTTPKNLPTHLHSTSEKVTSKGSLEPIFVETNVPKVEVEHGQPKKRKPEWELNPGFRNIGLQNSIEQNWFVRRTEICKW